jgi:hypothetical protein
MSLWQLEFTLGEDVMYKIMRIYHHRFRFKHPTSRDFMAVVNEVTGKDMTWFFQNTWFSSDLFDYTIDAIDNKRIPPPEGIFSKNGTPSERPEAPQHLYESTVVVKREGEAVSPVDVLVVFENGDKKTESWDGQYRWKKFTYETDSPVQYAIVDPERKIVMDVNYTNNSMVSRSPGFRSLAARKLATRWLFWVQQYLETQTFWH